MLQTLLRLPFYTTGALVGFFFGYLYLVVQVLRFIPGLGWLEQLLASLLPQDYLSKYPGSEDKSEVASRPESFAVMDAAALGNALYAMEAPAVTSTAAAAAAADSSNPLIINRPSTPDHHDLPNQITDLDLLQQQQQQQQQDVVMLCIRDRLSSFPLDHLSPATTATATALSSLITGLAPEGSLDDHDQDLFQDLHREDRDVRDGDPEHDDDRHSSGLDIGVGPLQPVEGELEITYNIHSSSDAQPPPAAAVTESFKDDSLLPQPPSGPSSEVDSEDLPVGTSHPDRLGTSADTEGNFTSVIENFSPAKKDLSALQQHRMTNDDIMQPSDRAGVSDQSQLDNESSSKPRSNPLKALLTRNPGPGPRSRATDLPDQQQQSVPAAAISTRAPAAAAVYPPAAAAAAAASDGVSVRAPDTPRSVASSSNTAVSSIRTTDSAATADRKKKKGLFAALKQKAVKGRQQVR